MIMKPMKNLSRREVEVIHLLLQGKSNKLIALVRGIDTNETGTDALKLRNPAEIL